MKNLILPFAVVFTISAQAQKPIFTQAKIESARIYANAAELKHKTTAQIPSGTSEIVITNVANYLNENTVQIAVPKNVTVMSVQFSNAYLEEYDNNVNSPLLKPVRDSIKLVEADLLRVGNSRISEQKTIELLDKNQQISNSQTFSVAELAKMVDFYKKQRNDLSNSVDALIKKESALSEKLNSLKGRLAFNQNSVENVSNGKLIVNVMSNQAANIPLEISYLTNTANWKPSYELRIDKINDPIQVLYKAQVVQRTGVDWKNVKLSLTSGLANASTFAPKLNTWFLDYYKEKSPVISNYRTSSAPMRLKANDSNANYEVAMDVESISAVAQSTMEDFTQLSESQLNMTFDIDIPYTILSNGKVHSVALKEMKVPATYSYIAIPKLDLNAYLIAKIKDYGNYNILPGEANVIFEDVFVGKTFINPNAQNEDLQLSLGKDTNIVISRTLLSDKSGTKMLSSRKVQDFVYEISIRNNKKQTIDLVLEDQIPMSSNNDIEVIVTEKDGANVNAETGKMTWNLTVKPNETKKIRFGYQVKSAKDKTLGI